MVFNVKNISHLMKFMDRSTQGEKCQTMNKSIWLSISNCNYCFNHSNKLFVGEYFKDFWLVVLYFE